MKASIFIAAIIVFFVNAYLITLYVDKMYQHKISLLSGGLILVMAILCMEKISKRS